MPKVLLVILLYSWVVIISCRKNEYTDNAIINLERGLHYMKRNAKLMNVDAIFGVVLAQANLHTLLQKGVPDEFRAKIRLLDYIANETFHQIRPHLEQNSKNILFSNTILVVEAWKNSIAFGSTPLNKTYFRKKFKNVNTLNTYLILLQNSDVTESEFDKCLIQLLEQQRVCCKDHKCVVSVGCQKLMIRNLDDIEPAYGATHSLLFFQIARSQKCQWNASILRKRIREYCSYIYWEVSMNYKFGFLPQLDDLFLEQVTLCGYEGFVEFLKDDFIEHILSLQASGGCFRLYRNSEMETYRNKRETNLLDHGCADHTTGLGVSALSIVLRYQLTII